ncbi:MAG: lamin tail domain-containing protein [Sandaracinaceae bacterium]
MLERTRRPLLCVVFALAIAALVAGCERRFGSDGGTDAGRRDAGGRIDAGASDDAGRADAGGGTDAGGATDAGTSDAGASDGGSSDAGSTDAGASDAGGGCAGGAPTASQLVINEIHAAPDADDDVNCDGVFDGQYEEFIEIVNATSSTLDTTGVELTFNGTVRTTLDVCLPPHGAIIVYRDTRITATSCALGASTTARFASLNLTNSGGMVELVGPSGTLDSVTYLDRGSIAGRPSLVRSPDYSGTFTDHTTADTTDASTYSAGTCIDGATFPSCAP